MFDRVVAEMTAKGRDLEVHRYDDSRSAPFLLTGRGLFFLTDEQAEELELEREWQRVRIIDCGGFH